MNKTVWASVATVMAVISAFSLYKIFKGGKKKGTTPKYPLTSDRNSFDEGEFQKLEDRVLYENEITDPEKYTLILQRPQIDSSIDELSYKVILNINKGTTYQGVVKIQIKSHGKLGNKRDLQIDFAGNCIMHVRVNGVSLKQTEFRYESHAIWLKREYLKETQNDIEIIFSNRYAFMGNGLTVYFPLQNTNKYSLKKQIVYSRNGIYQAPRIMPCLNVLNECKVQVEMLHAQGFDAFSNAPKSLYQTVSKQNYPNYTFMFQASERKLNRSFKLNSTYSEHNSSFVSFDDIVKENTRFYEHKLDSIHDLFLFCGKITEVRPSLQKECPILIRYYVREHLTAKAIALLNILQCQIIDIYNRIQNYKKQSNIMNSTASNDSSFLNQSKSLKAYHKVDIFFVDDINGESDFHKGSLLLNEKTIERGVIDRRIYYLICRAFVGMGFKNHHVMLNLSGKLDLNELTVSIFPECSDFIYLKQIEYKEIRSQCLELEQSKEQSAEELWATQFYEKHCKYFVRDENFAIENVTTAINKLVSHLEQSSNEEYWNQLISAYPFLQTTSAEILIKISLKQKGIPVHSDHLIYAKQNFKKSKYYLKFISNEEIENDLDKYISCYGVNYRLPFIKVKNKFTDLIIESNVDKYLKLKVNRLQAQNLYEQFKKFNEERSFHHYTIIKDEIKRIKALADDKIKDERRNLQCGLMGWKLLSKLRIYPEDEKTFELITKLLKMKGKETMSEIRQN